MHVQLTQGFSAIIDDEDSELVGRHKWHVQIKSPKKAYAISMVRSDPETPGRQRTLRMHRLILGVTDSSVIVDHINHNGLDNRRVNLRCVSAAENAWNRRPIHAESKFKGVSWCNRELKWRVYIRVRTKAIYVGLFKSEVDAARAYDEAARKHYGQYAFINFSGQHQHV